MPAARETEPPRSSSHRASPSMSPFGPVPQREDDHVGDPDVGAGGQQRRRIFTVVAVQQVPMSSTTDQALARLATAISPKLSTRSAGERPSIRRGLATINVTATTSSIAGKTQRPIGVRSAGRLTCNAIMSATATLTGQRAFPLGLHPSAEIRNMPSPPRGSRARHGPCRRGSRRRPCPARRVAFPGLSACVSKPPRLTMYTVVGTPAFTHLATRLNCCCKLECPPPDPAGDGSSAAGGVGHPAERRGRGHRPPPAATGGD